MDRSCFTTFLREERKTKLSQIMDTEEHLDQCTGQTTEDTQKPWATCN